MSVDIHPTAIVDKNAIVNDGVKIGPYSVIESDTVIGENTNVGSHVLIAEGTRIGEKCRVFKGAALGIIPQDLKFHGEKTTLEIGDNTTIREFATLNRGTEALGTTLIGNVRNNFRAIFKVSPDKSNTMVNGCRSEGYSTF